MQPFDLMRQLEKEKKCDTMLSIEKSEGSITENRPMMNAQERNVEDEPEVHILTEEEVNYQIRNHVAPLTKQLEDLTRLIQGMATVRHPTA